MVSFASKAKLVLVGILATCSGWAGAAPQVIDGYSGKATTWQEALKSVPKGSVVILGEEHGTTAQPPVQINIMQELRNQGHLVSVGLEFFEEEWQPLVDQYRAGTLSEADFLKDVKWQGFPYSSYREQALFPNGNSETIALDAPMKLTDQIAQVGMSGLTPEEKAELPPNWALGNDKYFERFKAVIGDHLPDPAALPNYFAAQCTWDDTMAWRAASFMQWAPEQTLVIVEGEFHVQYGGGTPDRLRIRLKQALGDKAPQVFTISLVNLNGLSDADQKAALAPSPEYGARATWIWADSYPDASNP